MSAMTRFRGAGAVLLAAVVLLAGCKDVNRPAAAPAPQGVAAVAEGPHNAYDVLFLQMMIGHQRQGLEMLRLGRAKGVREDVVNLAGAIDVTEAEEVDRMTGWLTGWNEPATGTDDHSGHATHGGQPATGEEQLKALRDASGADFETKFLNLLIAHQHNAVEMAQQLKTNGQNATVKQFAERIELSRTQQIRQMLVLVSG
ncbi:DUF305 domain-containing protein [Dactylosporangium aurantiacum]|uniref:DUF305 domain-containing protein n=1 Tax=Dactylosporangium aurantiacum TaxID=35754 RepID=A0A9Q9MPP7_9ACTN|nr:DUF305 domain-containing protein [Dactylosporangium aurantiacum]MDG6104178.1 DUF305 domain-containing protein [Dactylosporangium aurantiacum]UWZ56817.1 DUF305 domain-containing protein [Dactylosporangium aurantiacum]